MVNILHNPGVSLEGSESLSYVPVHPSQHGVSYWVENCSGRLLSYFPAKRAHALFSVVIKGPQGTFLKHFEAPSASLLSLLGLGWGIKWLARIHFCCLRRGCVSLCLSLVCVKVSSDSRKGELADSPEACSKERVHLREKGRWGEQEETVWWSGHQMQTS